VRDFFLAFREAGALLGEVAEAGPGWSFCGASIKPLHSHANAEEGHAAGDGGTNCMGQAGRVQALGGLEVADAGEDDALGIFN